MRTEKEISEYLEFMEKKVKGIVEVPPLPDPYDKGWYDALRWALEMWPEGGTVVPQFITDNPRYHRCDTCDHYDPRKVLANKCPVMQNNPDLDLADRCLALHLIGLVGCRSWEKKEVE